MNGKEMNKMLVYTCPKCGKGLQFSDIAAYPPVHIAECSSCGWREEKRDMIERIPYKTNTLISISDVYSKDEVITILTELQQEIENTVKEEELIDEKWAKGLHYSEKIIQQKINELKENAD